MMRHRMMRLGMTFRALGLAVVIVGLAGAGAAGAATLFTDRRAFLAGLSGPLITESFDADIATADSIRFGSGIVSTKSIPGVPPTLNRVRGGDFDGFVGRDGLRTIEWTLPTPVFGFGGDFGSGGTSFNSLTVTGAFGSGARETFSISEALGRQDGFFGVTSASAFSSLLFSTEPGAAPFPGAAPIGGQIFTADDVTIAPVPLPAGLPLMLSILGLGGVLGLRRRRALTTA